MHMCRARNHTTLVSLVRHLELHLGPPWQLGHLCIQAFKRRCALRPPSSPPNARRGPLLHHSHVQRQPLHAQVMAAGLSVEWWVCGRFFEITGAMRGAMRILTCIMVQGRGCPWGIPTRAREQQGGDRWTR
jgi:hypothetical protein